MNTPVNVMFFDNGNTAAFDKDGQQIPELQVPWLLMFTEFLQAHGFEPSRIKFEMPHGREARLIWLEEDKRYTWEMV